MSVALIAATGVLVPGTPASAETRNQVNVGANVNCNLNGLHQGQGPVSTCGDLTITTRVLVNGADVPAGTELEVGDTVTVQVVVPPRGGHDAFYQETVDGIRNNDRDQRFVIRVGLPGQTGTNLSAPTNVVMSRTDNGDRGNAPAINCLAHNGQEGARTDAPTAVMLGGSSVGSTQMNAAVAGDQLVARWDEMAYDRCVNVLSNNGYYAGMTLSFDQTVEQLGSIPLLPTWTMGQVSHELKNGSRQITWGSNADMSLTLGAVARPNAVPDNAVVDARYAGQAATEVEIDVLANDSGVGTLRITEVFATAAGGTVDCGGLPSTGTCRYAPPVGHSGADSFNYTVTDDNGSQTTQVNVVVLANAAPIAQDDHLTVETGQVLAGTVAGNDSDPDGDPLVYTTALVDGPANGVAVLAADGTFTYTPAAGFFGTDGFTYEVCDLHEMLDGPATSRCSVATVSITVTPGAGPVALADLAVTDTDVAVEIDVVANDDEGSTGPLTVTYAGTSDTAGATAAGGSVTCAATCTYTPPAGFSGTDAFLYTVTDGNGRTSSTTVLVSVVGNQAPVALDDTFTAVQDGPAITGDLSVNDFDLDGDVLTYDPDPVDGPSLGTVAIGADGTFTYTPDAGASGTDTFTYRVCDDHTTVAGAPAPACATATVTIVIEPTPPAVPEAVEDAAVTDRNIAVEIDVLANDLGDDLVVTAAGFGGVAGATTAGGTVTCDAVCTYTPPLGFSGTDLFHYAIVNGDGVEATSYVVVTVIGNVAPLAADDLYLTPMDTAVSGDLSSNDLDLDGHELVYAVEPVVAPNHGTVTIAPDGTFTYVPTVGWAGVDRFVYEVCDDHALLDGSSAPECAQAEVTVLVGVAHVDDLPDIDIDIDLDGVINVGDGGSGSGSGNGGSSGGAGSSLLARTGANVGWMAVLGLISLAGGSALLWRRRTLAA